MRLVQWFDPQTRKRHAGFLEERDGGEVAVSLTSMDSRISSTIDAIRRGVLKAAGKKTARAKRTLWNKLLENRPGGPKPHAIRPIDLPENPYAFSLWGAGVTHLRSAKAREEEAKAARGRPASFYDLMYEEGLRNGKPRKPPGARPEIFFKADGHYTVGPNEPVRIARTAIRCVPEPEVVSYYMEGRKRGSWRRIGYTLGNDFSDQGWESDNPLYLPHAKVQHGLAAIGPVFVTADDPLIDPGEIAIRCRIFRGKSVFQDSGAGRTGERHMAHSLANLEFHLFDNRPLRPGELRALFWGTCAVFKLPLKPADRIEIEASSGLGRLVNPTAAQI